MKNPWLKKNPFMSMWLSGANSVWNCAHGSVMAEARRQQAAMMQEWSNQMLRFWSGASMRPALTVPKRRGKKRSA